MSWFFSKRDKLVEQYSVKIDSSATLPVKEIKKRILAVVAENLITLGFKCNNKDDIWLRARSSVAYDRVFVAFVQRFAAERIIAYPVVGIQCPVLLDLLSAAFSYKYPTTHGVFGQLIGYVMPAKRLIDWHFLRDQEPEAEARKMMSAFVEYGLLFMERYDSLDAIIKGKRQYGLLGFRDVIELSALEYLAGRPDDARRTLEEALALKNAPDEEKPEFQIPSKEKARKLFEVFEDDAVRASIMKGLQ